MRKVEIIALDSGLLSRALWVLNNVWVISIFFLVCLFIPAMTYLGFLLYSSDPFLVWDRVSPLVVLVLWVGIGLALALGASLVGLFFLPIANKATNLFRINCAMRSRLRGSEKRGPVTRATLLALVVVLCTLVVVLLTIVRWNEGFEPGFPALTAGVIGFVVLVMGFQYFLPALRKWFYRSRRGIKEEDREFILLLRSFRGDLLHTRSRPFSQVDSVEGMVSDMLERFTSVVAVSDPRDATQPVGAERIALQTSDWQPRVLDLMDRAGGVVVVLDKSPGLKWELDRIFEKGRLAKAVFVVWSPDGGWLGGPWTELFERTGGGDVAPVTEKPGNKIALAATCANDHIRIAAASVHTPLNCGLAVSTLLFLSMVEGKGIERGG
jgi:hypothetical protein